MDIRFGTSGMRGLTDSEITPGVCWKVGEALARSIGPSPRMVIAHDTRPGARRLAGICAAAMQHAGASVVNLGVSPSPFACAAILTMGLDGGLMVTGSHLPYDRIGLIPLDSTGAIPAREETSRLAQLANSIEPPAEPSGALPEPVDFAFDFLTFTQEVVGSQLPGRGVKVALDPAGGTGAGTVSRLLNDLGCDVRAIYDRHLDYAPRRMEPRIDGVDELCDLVVDTGADLGAAYDSDCDRVLFVDETGKPLSEDLAAVILATYLYGDRGGTVVTPVNSSGLMRKVWKGGEVVECIIGPPEISKAARENQAVFAYEESGKYFFPPRVMWADGIIATAMMASILSRTRKSLSSIASEFPRHVQVKRNVKGTWEQMADLVDTIRREFRPEGAVLNDIDGLKYVFGDGSWLLIRPSGTEPLLRVYTDSPSPTRARQLSEMGLETVRRLMGSGR